jgi:anti-sigma-K factor RskA
LDCPEVREELGAHAIGALTDDEARQIEAHLATCADCTAEAITYADASTALSFGVPGYAPSAELRRRVLDEVAATPALRARRSIAPWAAAAAAVVVAGLLGWNLWLQFGEDDAAASDQLVALMRQQDTTFAIMQGDDDAWAVYAWEPGPRLGHLFAQDLPGLPEGMVYEFWYVTDEGPVSGGTFEPEGDGYTHAATQPEREAGRPTSYAVSIEPVNGSEEPEGEMVLTAERAP